MEIYEITGFRTGVSQEGVNFLEPADSFTNIRNGYIHRQELKSREGFSRWSNGYDAGAGATGHLQTRVMGIFENQKTLTSTTETLAFDKNFAYKYNNTSNEFDLIPFGGSLSGYAGFALSSNDAYIHGTTYPDKNGNNRFVFTGRGMPGVFFYDGSEILDWTNAADNPDYQAFVDSTLGAQTLNRATQVWWFGDRINFMAPTLDSVFYPQRMLFSAIRSSDGDGDKFNTAGAGILKFDTPDIYKGSNIFGDRIVVNMSGSNWIVEKTRDVFNPYFSRKIPSVLGTDATFSGVVWGSEEQSLGKTGIISTDGRQSTRIDNKIPYFTEYEIDAVEFELTYGGFDRDKSQFLWAYLGENSTESTQQKVLVNNYEENSWSINDQRFSCFGETINGQNLAWNDINATNKDSWATWNTTKEIWSKIGLGKQTYKTLAGDNLGFIYELNVDYDDYSVAIKSPGITQSSSAVVSTEDQAIQVGDLVYFSNVEGMTEINGQTGEVTARTLSTLTVNIDTSQYAAWTSGGLVSKPIAFYAETVPFNPYRYKGKQVYVSHIEYLINTETDGLLVDIFMDDEFSPWKENVLLVPDNRRKRRQWVSVSVNNICEFMSMALKKTSAIDQVIVSSIRIHCQEEGLTTD